MRRKLFALLLTVLLTLTTLVPAAFAGGSVFPTKYKIEKHMFDASSIPNVNYNSLYVNSKGDVWIPTVNKESKDDFMAWMYKVNLKNDSVLKKVPVGEVYFNMLYKPSPDGRYLYFPTVKTHLVFGFHAIDSYHLTCFDAEEGEVVWDKYIKKCNNGDLITSFTDYLPVQDGVIELFTNEDYIKSKDVFVYKTIVLKMSVKGDKLWDITIPGKFGIVTYDKRNLLLSNGKKLLSLDTKTGIYEEEGKLSMEVNAPEPIANRGTPTFSGDTVYYVSKATDVEKEWRLYRFTRSNGKNELVEIVSHLPMRNNPCSVIHRESLFMSAVYDGYFVFIDSLGDFHDQNVYVYDKNGKLLWHIDVTPAYPDCLAVVTPVFANGMFFYSTQSVMHAVDMKTGRDVYSVDLGLGNTIFDYVDAAEDNGTVWTYSKNATKNQILTHFFKITEEKALLTVNTNIKDGSFDIVQKDKKETVKFGSKVELPPGNYTLHFHGLDGVSGVKAPDDVNVSLKDNENKVLNVEYKDVEPPVITVEPISQPTVMGGVAYFTIKGTVKDNFSGVKSVSVNGTEVSIDKDGSFSKTVIVREKGTVTFVISADDNAGNRADKTITADYNPPIVIRLKPNSKMFFVNETAKILDSPPVIIPKWNRTVVPIRAIVEALGGTVSWDPVERMVTINLGDNMINLWIGKPQAMVNGVMKWIDDSNHDVKPIIINDRTMLPLRFVAENLGCTVNWDPVTRTITIKYTP